MKYKSMYWMMFSPFMKKIMSKKYGKENAKEYIKKAKPIYRQMLEQAENIGADNPMAKNMYMCFVFLAIWKAAQGVITADDMREMTEELLGMEIVKKVMGNLDINKPEDMEKMRAMLHKGSNWADEHPEYKDKTWDFHFDETADDSISYYFTRCPLYEYSKKYGYMEILPVMCDLDFLTAKLYHAKLYRKYTLAGGGSICDYRYVGDQQLE